LTLIPEPYFLAPEMNYLKAVFWDYPTFTEEKGLRNYLQQSQGKASRRWIMSRFLEHGRVIDTLQYFTLDEIKENLPDLKISTYIRLKWSRIIEVYG
jgi:hypothetical protein